MGATTKQSCSTLDTVRGHLSQRQPAEVKQVVLQVGPVQRQSGGELNSWQDSSTDKLGCLVWRARNGQWECSTCRSSVKSSNTRGSNSGDIPIPESTSGTDQWRNRGPGAVRRVTRAAGSGFAPAPAARWWRDVRRYRAAWSCDRGEASAAANRSPSDRGL